MRAKHEAGVAKYASEGKSGAVQERGGNGRFLKGELESSAGEELSKGGRGRPPSGAGEGEGEKTKYGPPAKTYREALPDIAGALSERAKKGSYLHARALKEIVEAEALKKVTRGRKEKGFAQQLLEKLRELEERATSISN